MRPEKGNKKWKGRAIERCQGEKWQFHVEAKTSASDSLSKLS